MKHWHCKPIIRSKVAARFASIQSTILVPFVVIRCNGPCCYFLFWHNLASAFWTEQTVSWDRERSRGIGTGGSRNAAVEERLRWRGRRDWEGKEQLLFPECRLISCSEENCTRGCSLPGESAYYAESNALFQQ